MGDGGGESMSGKGYSKCKSPGAGMNLPCLRNRKVVSVGEHGGKTEVGEGVRGQITPGSPEVHGEEFRLYSSAGGG